VKLIAWKLGRRWTCFHVAAFGKPLCGRPVPDALQRTTTMDARPQQWLNGSICRQCREVLLRRGPAEVEAPIPTLTGGNP